MLGVPQSWSVHDGEGKNPCLSRQLGHIFPVSYSSSFDVVYVLFNMQGYVYGRSGNPSRQVLETCLASLDGAKYGLCFASGLGATTAIVHLLNSGDHIVSVDDLYGGTYRYFNKVSVCGSSLISQITAGIFLWKGRS
jgi:cystathionine gamma-lyase